MTQADQLGRAEFLRANGFGVAAKYLVTHAGHFYDPKALIGVAHGLIEGRSSLAPGDFDATEAIARLRALHFEVVDFSRLWWVNQGSTYRAERDGAYVWAPKVNKLGRPVAHHVAVSELRVGDRLAHYANGNVRAIGYVVESPTDLRRPQEFTTDAWGEDGFGCRVVYQEISTPIPLAEIPQRSASVGPFDRNGSVKQGYLFRVDDAAVFPILEVLAQRVPNFFAVPDAADLPFLSHMEAPVTIEILQEDPIHDLLIASKNVVLEGVPGTGKSYAIERLSSEWFSRTGRQLVQFGRQRFAAQVMHPSTSYEDFVEGIRPGADVPDHSQQEWFDRPPAVSGTFAVNDGFFIKACRAAVTKPDHDVLVLIDEFNRCNVPSVLGDLLLTLESSRRARFSGSDPSSATASDWEAKVAVQLPYSGRMFFVPDNVYVVATTNTTDRSVAPLDAAIRRRFAFFRIEPSFVGVVDAATRLPTEQRTAVAQAVEAIEAMNAALLTCVGPEVLLGPSYVYDLARSLELGPDSPVEAHLSRIWRFSLMPQLVDSLRSFGAEDLLDPTTRKTWFVEHGAELTGGGQAESSLARLDAYLASVGLRVEVRGTGLARGARVLTGTSMTIDATYPAAGTVVEVADDQL